jgi:hypothetical protein
MERKYVYSERQYATETERKYELATERMYAPER